MSAAPSARVTLISGTGADRQWHVDTALSIGRDAGCDVVIEDTAASRQHAELRFTGSSLVLRDLGSANGTRVNDQRVSESILADGDVIQIGGACLRVDMSPSARDPKTQPVSAAAGTPNRRRVAILVVLMATLVVGFVSLLVLGGNDAEPSPSGDRPATGPDSPETTQPQTPADSTHKRGAPEPEAIAAGPAQSAAVEKFEQARTLYQYRRYAEARAALRQALALAPDYSRARLLLEETEVRIDNRVGELMQRARNAAQGLRRERAIQALEEVLFLISDEDTRRKEAIDLLEQVREPAQE